MDVPQVAVSAMLIGMNDEIDPISIGWSVEPADRLPSQQMPNQAQIGVDGGRPWDLRI